MRTMLSLVLLAASSAAYGQATGLPAALEGLGIEQKLDGPVPEDLTFRDHTGKPVRLEDLRSDRPVVLALVYYECPMLCTLVLNGLLRSMNVLELTAGADYDVITVSIDPRETPALARDKRTHYLDKYRRPPAEKGWHFLVGDEPQIRRLAQSVGFGYRWDEQTQQYVHASAIMVLTPEHRVARYFFGVEYDPTALRLSLVEAGRGAIGNLVDAVMLYCFQYDPATGRYSLLVMKTLRAAAVLTVVSLGLLIGTFLFRERLKSRAKKEGARTS